MAFLHGKLSSVAQSQNYNRQSQHITMYTKLYNNLCIQIFPFIMYTYVPSLQLKKAENEKKNCGTGSDNTTLCILFAVVMYVHTEVPSTTTSVYNALELRTMEKKDNVSTDSATHPPQHDNNGDAYVMSIKTGYKWFYFAV